MGLGTPAVTALGEATECGLLASGGPGSVWDMLGQPVDSWQVL